MLELFAKHKDFENRDLVITDAGQHVTYGEFHRFSEDFSANMSEGDLIFILCRNTLGSLLGYLTCLKYHIVPVMLEGNMAAENVVKLMEEYEPKYLLVPKDRMEEFQGEHNDNVVLSKQSEESVFFTRLKSEFFDYVLLENCEQLKQEKKIALHPNLALLLTTSGSTGSPKLVRQSQENINANTASIVEYLKLTKEERPVTVLPMNYTFGLSIIHSHVAVGATILLTTYGIFEKGLWQFMMEERATSVSGVPYTFEMLKRIGFMDMDLPHLTTMTQAGGRLSPKLQEEYGEFALRNNKRFVVMYGQTEATARMSYLPPEDVVRKCGSIGFAIPGGTFSLIDENENIITEADVTGELIYEGKNVTMGYAECKADLQKGDELNGVLHTGDMAKRDEEGYYYITGRKKRFVKLYGNRVSLDETEKILREHFDEEFACCGADDHMKIFSTLDKGEEIVEYVSQWMKISSKAFEYLKIEQIPKNEAGKTLYTELEKK